MNAATHEHRSFVVSNYSCDLKKIGFLKADVIRGPDQLANKVLCEPEQFNESERRSPFNTINNQHEHTKKG